MGYIYIHTPHSQWGYLCGCGSKPIYWAIFELDEHPFAIYLDVHWGYCTGFSQSPSSFSSVFFNSIYCRYIIIVNSDPLIIALK